ncbi:hypothetical protein [Flagellimonas allohymeniacidonis]|uniref:hypothetical protein n=1 Tax=Flagellimonas allohymeniacidonis TaxID=2517819 RepID=UPI0013EE3F74|nr:hypothetical protein [Allomuricauda hymeniacidonis]
MKKVFTLIAMAVFTLGLFSCEAETNVEETESLFETIDAKSNAVDGDDPMDDDRQ